MAKEKKEIDWEGIAGKIFFDPQNFDPKKFDVVFRKGRTNKNINWSIKQSLKKGNGDTNQELDWLALYLKEDVFKRGPANA